MTNENYLQSLNAKIQAIDFEITKAQRLFEEGKLADKVTAAGDLAILNDRKQALSEKIESAAAHHAEDWSTLHSDFEKSLDALSEELEQWITSHI